MGNKQQTTGMQASADQRDAARYRWLKERAPDVLAHIAYGAGSAACAFPPTEVDAAIDAVMPADGVAAPTVPSFDVEAMLRECVPAGSFFGSLKVADAIRAYVAARGVPPSQAPSPPDFIRRRIEQAIHESAHPKGMSLNDGKVRVLGADLAYLLRVVDGVKGGV